MLTKNSIKQFLKPDRRKIIITIILSLFIFLPVIHKITVYSCVLGGDVAPTCEGGMKEFEILFLLSIPVSYLIACILISIWDKIKAKKPVV